MSYILTAEVNC